MKLQGETATPARETSKVLFLPVLRKSRIAPEATVAGRHLECEEGSYDDRGIITKLLRKVGALSRGESTFFRTRTYSPQRRSKSQERGSISLPITPFFSKNNQPVLRTFKNVSTQQSCKRLDSFEAKRLSCPNVLSDKHIQVQEVEFTSSDKIRQSDKKITKLSTECKESKNSSEVLKSNKNSEHVKKEATTVILVANDIVQSKTNSERNVSTPSENEIQKVVTSKSSTENLKDDESKNELVKVSNGVTRIQIKYSTPKEEPTSNQLSQKNYVPTEANHHLKLLSNKTNLPKENFIESAIPSGVISSTTTTKAPSYSPPTSHQTSYPSSLRSIQASSKSSKSHQGRMTIRPASNLNASKLKSEFLKLTEFNDIKVGEFSLPAKPKKRINLDEEEYAEELVSSLETTRSTNAEKSDDDVENFEFIGAGIIQGKSILGKTKSNKRRSVNFSESPVIHLIEDVPNSPRETIEIHSTDDGSKSNLFSSLTSATSKGGFSSYKSKTLTDFEFDLDSLPLSSTSEFSTNNVEILSVGTSLNSEEALLWSSSGTNDLLF